METNSNVEVMENELRDEVNDQVAIDEVDLDSYESEEIPEDEGGLSYGLIGGLCALGAGAITGGVILYKKIKSGEIKQKFEDGKKHRELMKEKRARIKEIKAKSKDEIKQILAAPVEADPEEVTETPATEVVDNKKSSKK